MARTSCGWVERNTQQLVTHFGTLFFSQRRLRGPLSFFLTSQAQSIQIQMISRPKALRSMEDQPRPSKVAQRLNRPWGPRELVPADPNSQLGWISLVSGKVWAPNFQAKPPTTWTWVGLRLKLLINVGLKEQKHALSPVNPGTCYAELHFAGPTFEPDPLFSEAASTGRVLCWTLNPRVWVGREIEGFRWWGWFDRTISRSHRTFVLLGHLGLELAGVLFCLKAAPSQCHQLLKFVTAGLGLRGFRLRTSRARGRRTSAVRDQQNCQGAIWLRLKNAYPKTLIDGTKD